ncbi:MAG: RNA polymerase sigma factor [Clostridia bacterium]|nr:RNA polymerase sigma factor [Clostridia bacterium]
MEDESIIELFFARDEKAIEQVQQKYYSYCRRIAWNILKDDRDAEECVNDLYMRLWNSIPPNRPQSLTAFIARLTRNLALDRYKAQQTDKRRAENACVPLDELDECIQGDSGAAVSELGDAINRFLRGCSQESRKIFVSRYFFAMSIEEISAKYGISSAKTRTQLTRTRKKLKDFLIKEGI